MLGAKNFVSSRSSFAAFFLVANPFRDQVFIPLASPENHRKSPFTFKPFPWEFCDVWNLNQGICSYVQEAYFYYPRKWNGRKTQTDSFATTCHGNISDLGPEPL